MINKDKILDKLTYSNVNKTFGAILFVLVFIFTFLLTANDLRPHQTIVLIVFGSVVGFAALCWGGLILIVRHHKNSKDQNKKKINKALDKLKKDALEESKKQSIDESNN